LSQIDKEMNQSLERTRASANVSLAKVFKILAQRYRNRRNRFGLRFNLITGLYNWLGLSKLSWHARTLMPATMPSGRYPVLICLMVKLSCYKNEFVIVPAECGLRWTGVILPVQNGAKILPRRFYYQWFPIFQEDTESIFGIALGTKSKLDFVGSLSNGPNSLGDKDHEGHSGGVDEIASSINGWLSAQPDIIILMIGTNDMIVNFDVGNAPARLSALNQSNLLPNANLVASIPPIREYRPSTRISV